MGEALRRVAPRALLVVALATGCAARFPPGWFYVTRVDRTAATVVWTGAGGTATCRPPGGAPVSTPGAPRGRGLVAARIEGLAPGTRYACRIRAGDGTLVARVHFETAPATPADELLFTVVGDSGHGGPVARAIARRIRASHPAFLVHVGDLAYVHGSVDDLRRRLFPPYRRTLARVPFYPTPGNHDRYHRSAYRDLFAPVGDGGGGDGFRYEVTWGPAFLLSLSAADAALGAPGAADTLARAGGRWRIVFLHEPLYTAGFKRVEPNLRTAFGPVVEAAAVDLVLAGHQHFYERSVPTCRFVPAARVLNVTSGGGSASSLDPVRTHPNFPRALSTPHFLRVRVTRDTLTVRAVGPDGRTLDRVRRRRGVDPGCRADGWPKPQPRR